MAIDLARLSIEVDTTGLKAGDAAMKQMAATGAKLEAATNKAGAGMAQAGTQARQMGVQIQGARMQTANIAAQFNDIGVMLAAGQSPMMLALQQGTQLNQVFAQMGSGRDVLRGLGAAFTAMINPMSLATIGIIAGGAALVQWGMSAFQAGQDTRTFGDALDQLKDVTDGLKSAQEILLMSTDDLVAKYGQYAETVREAARELLQIRVIKAEDALRDQYNALGDVVDQYTSATKAGRAYRNTLQRISDDFGMSRDQAESFNDILLQLEQARTFEDQKTALEAVRVALDAAGISIEQMPDGLRDAIARMNELQIAAAAAAAEMERGAAAAQDMTTGVPLFLQGFSGAGLLPPNAPPSGGRTGGGGGKSDAQREFEASQREAERLLLNARTAAEKYADEIARVNELQAMGLFTGEEAAKVIANITDKYTEAGDAAKFWDDTQRQFNEGLLDAIVNGRELSDVFQQLAKSIAKAALEAAFFNTGPLAGGGGGIGGLLGGLFGGFRAEGGPVDAGRAYVVGERGPEMFVPKTGGTIVPNGGATKVIVEASPYFDVRVQEVSGAVVSANNQQIARQQGAAKW